MKLISGSKVFRSEDEESWKLLISGFNYPLSDVYYDLKYLKVFEAYGEGKPECFYFMQDKQFAMYPFLINSVNKLGFNLSSDYYDIQGVYGYNGVLTNSYDPVFIDSFYNSFSEFCSNNNIIAEFTRFNPLLGNYKFSEKHMNVFKDRETVALDLTRDYSDIWENEYSSKNRNIIRKARKMGYTSEVLRNPPETEIERFITIYNSNMQMVNATNYYFFNRDFFKNTFNLLGDYAHLINVLDNSGEVVCSSIFLHYGKYFHYHFSGRVNGSDNSVNSFLLDEAVIYAKGLGAKIFHFGGGRSSAPDDSLLKFKSNFSKTRLPFCIGKKVHNQAVYNEVVKQWEAKNPEKIEKYKNRILKYRF